LLAHGFYARAGRLGTATPASPTNGTAGALGKATGMKEVEGWNVGPTPHAPEQDERRETDIPV
jgi:hypothetical protein